MGSTQSRISYTCFYCFSHLDDGLEGGRVGDGQHTEQDQLDLLLVALYSP